MSSKEILIKSTELFKRHGGNYSIFIISYAIVFYTNILVANHYLAELYGQYQFFTNLIIFLLSVSQVGTTQSFIVFASKKINRGKLITSSYILRFLGFLAVALCMAVFFFFTHQPLLAYLFVLYLLPQTVNIAPVLDFYKKSYVDTKYNFMFDVIPSLITTFICINLGFSIEVLVISRILTKTISEIFKLQYIRKNFSKLQYSWRYLKWLFKKSLIFIVNRFLVNFYSRSELLLLGFLTSGSLLGVYAAACSVSGAILMITGLMDRQLFPKQSQAFGNYEKTKNALVQSALIKSLYIIPVMILTYTFGSKIIFTMIFDKSEYFQSMYILNIMTIGYIANIFTNNTNLMLMKKDQGSYIKRFSLGIVLNIVLGYVFYLKFSIYGFAIAIVLVKLLTILYSITVSSKMLAELKDKESKGINYAQ